MSDDLSQTDEREKAVDEKEVELFYDIALKRHEYLTKAYDTVNTRVGLVFGFSGLVIASGSSAFKEMKAQSFPVPAMVSLGLVVFAAFGFLAYHCWKAYSIQPVKLLPNTQKMYTEWVAREDRYLIDIKRSLISNQLESIVNKSFIDALAFKTYHLNRALFCAVAEVALIFVVSCLPYMATWSSAMTQEKSHPAEKKQTTDMGTQGANPSPPPNKRQAPPPADMFLAPDLAESIGMGRSIRGTHTMEKSATGTRTLERSPRKS